MATIKDVVDRDICVGCGACSVATSGRIPVTIGKFGAYRADLDAVDESDIATGSRVCPWATASPDLDTVANQVHGDELESHPVIGKYDALYTGRINSDEEISQSSSGGLTSWTALELLRKGDIDGVIHVGPSDSELFEYTVSHSTRELQDRRKSMYYSTTFAQALTSVMGNGKRYAFIGVPCFVRAARNLCSEVPGLSDQVVYFLGLVCGHLKSPAFAEALAWQVGVNPTDLKSVDFRVKNKERPASQYDFGATGSDSAMHLAPTPSLIGGNWGHAMFQLNACNYCEDIFAETADIAFGDAWLPEYESDWRGTNVIVIRNKHLQELFQNASDSGEIDVQHSSPEVVAKTQAGNYRHRRQGLAVRLADDLQSGLWIPDTRIDPSSKGVSEKRIKIIRSRRKIAENSHIIFEKARNSNDLKLFLNEIDPLLKEYKSIESRSIGYRALRSLKRSIEKFARRFF